MADVVLRLVPSFDSDDEEWRFWDTHSVLDFEHREVDPDRDPPPGAKQP